MKIKEQLGSSLKDFKSEVSKEISSKADLTTKDSLSVVNSMMKSLPENEEEEEQIVRKKTYKSPIKNLVGNKKIKKPINKITTMKPIMGEQETKESMGAVSAGAYSTQLFSEPNEEMNEKWSEKYKNSIDCNNPKGFSQRAHCQGKKKKENKEETSKGEFKEATGSASSGQYQTTAAWAKTLNKKDWGPSRKPQIPGGKFVQVKKKCKKFPYCNQGDIKALKIFENETVKKVITNISKKHNISENVIKTILSYEYENSLLNK